MPAEKRFFVYPDELADEPVDVGGEYTHLDAEQLAELLYGPGNHADIRKEYANELSIAGEW